MASTQHSPNVAAAAATVFLYCPAGDAGDLADKVSAGVADMGLSEPAAVRGLPSKDQQRTAAQAAAEAPAGQA
jgi:hypothetical protein